VKLSTAKKASHSSKRQLLNPSYTIQHDIEHCLSTAEYRKWPFPISINIFLVDSFFHAICLLWIFLLVPSIKALTSQPINIFFWCCFFLVDCIMNCHKHLFILCFVMSLSIDFFPLLPHRLQFYLIHWRAFSMTDAIILQCL